MQYPQIEKFCSVAIIHSTQHRISNLWFEQCLNFKARHVIFRTGKIDGGYQLPVCYLRNKKIIFQ